MYQTLTNSLLLFTDTQESKLWDIVKISIGWFTNRVNWRSFNKFGIKDVKSVSVGMQNRLDNRWGNLK